MKHSKSGKKKLTDSKNKMASSSESNASSSLPEIESNTSRGSSVSSDFQREYEDLLKYAIVTPRFQIGPDAYSQQKETDMTTDQFRPKATAQKTGHNTKAMNLSTIVELSSTEHNSSVDDTERKQTAVDRPKSQQKAPFYQSSRRANQEGETEIAEKSVGSVALQRLIGNDRQHQHLWQTDQNQSTESLAASPSTSMNDEIEETIDEDMIRMEGLMDEWCLELKRNFLGEFSHSKMKLLQKMQNRIKIQKQHHASEVNALQNQIENLKELLHTYEKSIHQKDVVITNLTDAVQKQKEKQEKVKVLLTWKLKHNDEKREEFASKLAQKHYQKNLMSKIWLGWRTVIEMRWKQRVERACQARSQEVCIKLTEDYEERLRGLQKSLEMARQEVARMHSEREQYEETMKKAFMRGVCALNMEAMGMFRENGNEENLDPAFKENGNSTESETASQGAPSSATWQAAKEKDRPIVTSNQRTSSARNMKDDKKRLVHVKAIGKSSFAGTKAQTATGVGRPKITSVFVEKHGNEREAAMKNDASYNKSHITSNAQRQPRSSQYQTVKVVE